MDTVWLIVGAAMSVVIGSVFWILPSPSDRRRMALRQIAFRHGFQVRGMKPEEIMKKFALATDVNLLYYYSKQGLFKGYTTNYGRFANLVAVPCGVDWKFYSAPDAGRSLSDLKPLAALNNPNNSITCFFFSEKEAGMLWNERADAHATEHLLDLLEIPFVQAGKADSNKS